MTVTELKVWFMTQCTFNNECLSLAHDLISAEAVAEKCYYEFLILVQGAVSAPGSEPPSGQLTKE